MTKLQLFCLPYSGASAMFYSRWRRRVPSWLEIHPVELPGRGTRFGEELPSDLVSLAADLAKDIRRQLKQPYAIFGHSLGALLGFEVAHALSALGCPQPLSLCASGTSAPTRREDGRRGYDKPKTDDELITDLREFEGTPEEVLENEELLSLTLPILRADFLLCGLYRYRPRPSLGCHIHVLAGRSDDVSTEQLIAWHEETTGDFSLDMFEGGHFFIHDEEPHFLRTLKKHLASDIRQYEGLYGMAKPLPV